ncbi:uncharacterized protein LOC118435087 [Folsomia candida]|uniref:Uncharacterized protein n=1 Tax=Folsomia candida TaxID=158441 RepID=A0A226EL36_FOLCA|nr:uncharacterized protein LOC118435087 [Folsomia candida]OXA57928.1 hypothetical protein Fcan01_07612 [Folsomia candida]
MARKRGVKRTTTSTRTTSQFDAKRIHVDGQSNSSSAEEIPVTPPAAERSPAVNLPSTSASMASTILPPRILVGQGAGGRQSIGLKIETLVRHLDRFVAPAKENNKGSWLYKFNSAQEFQCVLEAIVVFIEKNDGSKGINLFEIDNLGVWKEALYNSQLPFFVQRKKFDGSRSLSNLAKKYARFSQIHKAPLTFPEFLPLFCFLVHYLYNAKQQSLHIYAEVEQARQTYAKIVQMSNKFVGEIDGGQQRSYRVLIDFDSLQISGMAFPLAQETALDAKSCLDRMMKSTCTGKVDDHPLISKADNLFKKRESFVAQRTKVDTMVKDNHAREFHQKAVTTKEQYEVLSAIRLDFEEYGKSMLSNEEIQQCKLPESDLLKFVSLSDRYPQAYARIMVDIDRYLVAGDGQEGMNEPNQQDRGNEGQQNQSDQDDTQPNKPEETQEGDQPLQNDQDDQTQEEEHGQVDNKEDDATHTPQNDQSTQEEILDFTEGPIDEDDE